MLMPQGLTFDQNIFGFSQEKGIDKTILYGRMIETQASDTEANERNLLVRLDKRQSVVYTGCRVLVWFFTLEVDYEGF